jgi:CHASE3 domain sensor protein
MLKMLKKQDVLLFCVPAALYLTLSASVLLITPQESIAQTSTNQTMQNQTSQQTSTNQTMQNQSVLQRGNVTAEDLDPIEDNLLAAREALQGKFNQTAFNLLSDVNNDLFRMVRLAGPDSAAVMQELQPMQTAIDSAQDAIRNNDIAKALQDLGSADIVVLRINQQVMTAEGPPEEQDEE